MTWFGFKKIAFGFGDLGLKLKNFAKSLNAILDAIIQCPLLTKSPN